MAASGANSTTDNATIGRIGAYHLFIRPAGRPGRPTMPRWPSREFANRIKPRAGTKKKGGKKDEKEKKKRARAKERKRARERERGKIYAKERTRRFARIKVPAIFTYRQRHSAAGDSRNPLLLPTDRYFSIGAPRAFPGRIPRRKLFASRDIKVLIISFRGT